MSQRSINLHFVCFIIIRMSYCCTWNSICGSPRCWWGARPPAHALFFLYPPPVCSLKWSEQAAYCEWADSAAETSQRWRWFIISFSRSGRHYLHRCSEDLLMCATAEPLTAQWTDKCGSKAVTLVCLPLLFLPTVTQRWLRTTPTAALGPGPPLWSRFFSRNRNSQALKKIRAGV